MPHLEPPMETALDADIRVARIGDRIALKELPECEIAVADLFSV